jgi:hypothetical protein
MPYQVAHNIIAQKHKQHNIILVFGSFSTLSSIVENKKKTTINYNKRQKIQPPT